MSKQEMAAPETMPRKLNLGSGKSYDPAQLNIDVNPQWQPDVLVDLSERGALDRVHDCGRFGKRTLPLDHFESIQANDVLEHVRELVTLMEACLALLRDGGRMFIQVPYDLSLGAWQDPTHVRAFNQNSWHYYTHWYWYLGWTASRFDVESLVYIVSPLGDRMQKEGKSVDDIVATARAVDAMHVALRKRPLTAEEAAYTVAMSARKPGPRNG